MQENNKIRNSPLDSSGSQHFIATLAVTHLILWEFLAILIAVIVIYSNTLMKHKDNFYALSISVSLISRNRNRDVFLRQNRERIYARNGLGQDI